MNVVLPDDVEERFRRAVFERMGMKKGNIKLGTIHLKVRYHQIEVEPLTV